MKNLLSIIIVIAMTIIASVGIYSLKKEGNSKLKLRPLQMLNIKMQLRLAYLKGINNSHPINFDLMENELNKLEKRIDSLVYDIEPIQQP